MNKKFFKNRLKIIIGFIIGSIISSSAVYAATIAASTVTYTAPSGNGTASGVQAAINELYQQAQNAGEPSTEKDYFLYGVTKDTTSHNLQPAAGVCGNFNGNIFCMKHSDSTNQANRLKTFCTSISGTYTVISGVVPECRLDKTFCWAYNYGRVACGYDKGYCDLDPRDGDIKCGTMS